MKGKKEDSWSYSGVKRRDFRADKSGPEEIPRRPSPKGKKIARSKGCPENNGKEHVYSRAESIGEISRDATKIVPGGREIIGKWVSTFLVTRTTCVGCGHVKNTEYDWEAYLNNTRFRAINMADQHTIGS